MRVVFLEDVAGVAQGGDVKEVKNGFARNYLIPKNLAVPATHNALQRIKRLAREADVVRLKRLNDMRELAQELNESRVKVEMRAGASGRLYGSVTNAIIADELSRMVDGEIDRRMVLLDEPLRELGPVRRQAAPAPGRGRPGRGASLCHGHGPGRRGRRRGRGRRRRGRRRVRGGVRERRRLAASAQDVSRRPSIPPPPRHSVTPEQAGGQLAQSEVFP